MYKRQAIRSSGGIDGIAIHINSRGYKREDVFSTQKVRGNYWSFFCYKDWLERGIPQSLWHLPVFATECNGYYYWKGSHAEAPSEVYHPGWVQAVLLEIDRWNHNEAIVEGKPFIRVVCFYRWCAFCDGWNIDGSPQESTILNDLAQAARYRLTVPERTSDKVVPFTIEIKCTAPRLNKGESPYYGIWRSFAFRLTGTRSREVLFYLYGTAKSGADDDDARLIIDDNDPTDPRSWNTEAALDGSRDRGKPAVAFFKRVLTPGRHILRLQVDSAPYIDRIEVRFPKPKEVFKRGDANADGEIDIADATFLLQYLFAGGSFPPCLDAADSNDDGKLDLSDSIFLLTYLFSGETRLPDPVKTCGADPTEDLLNCRNFPPCN